ncbi:penicillin-binding protein [Desulfuromonas versatilis]|uniref:penicillin-binding protein n=1 Tax=Desulfuromonas versatilis TaxID=2802975 RepID=UPI00298FEC22|nr:penicillin-binding protein [Desulfuromonas versatilis]
MRFRIRMVCLVFVVAFCLVAVRAFQLQVQGEQEWRKRAERQHQKVIPLTPRRGTIFDRNGEELALSIEVDSIYVQPRQVTDPAAAARALSGVLSMSAASLKAKLSSGKSFLWLKRQVTPRESELVRALEIAGVGFTKEHRRFYPNSEQGAQVIGFTGVDPKGLEGVELKYDAEILGQSGYLVTERDALGRGIGSGEVVIEGQNQGSNLQLTIDKNIQYIAEKELAAGVREANAKAGTVVVLDPMTGEVLAMASQPDFNPNAFYKYRPNQWRNRAICDTFEPGSTLKLFMMAAALNEGLVRMDQKIYCENGVFKVGGKVIHDHHKYKDLSVLEILKYSSNIGSAKIGKMLERERLYRYLTDFGFGQNTGIDLPGEVPGLLRRPSQWFEIDLAAISFGQGMTITALQLARATAAIANGGYLMDAPVVSKVTDHEGRVLTSNPPRAIKRVVSEDVARQVREMMTTVSEEGGTGTLAAVPGFRVAGKTGTAQKVDPVTGGYSVDKRVASFVGFVPAENPRLVILSVIDEPEGKTYGGLVAAPVFSRIASQSLRYLKVAPTAPLPAGPMALPPVMEVSVPLEEPTLATLEPADGGAPIMPNFSGMSYRQVLQTMGKTGVNLRLKGHGRVVEQSPPAGRPISYSSEAWVRLAPPT